MTPHPPKRPIAYGLAVLTLCAAAAGLHAAPQGYAFWYLEPGFTQHVFGSTKSFLRTGPVKGYLGGVVVLQNGDVISAECETSTTRLHRFDADVTYVKKQTELHQETIVATRGGCGIALHPDGFIYSNMYDGTNGVSRIDPATGASSLMGPPGNALGIAVDPLTNHLVYPDAGCKPAFVSPPRPTCTLVDLDPVTGVAVPFAVFPTSVVGYADGVAFDPTGTYLFLTNRYPTWDLVVVSRLGQIVQQVPMWSEPVGLGFHASRPKFVVTNNQDGTLTRFDFPGDNYAAPPSMTEFANGGFRGDLMQAGPNGCLYLTQDGTRYNDGDETNNGNGVRANSIVQICGGFATPPGVTPDPPEPTSFCGAVYEDLDDDGIRDPGEAGIGGVAIALTGSDDLGSDVALTTTTGADGSYCFTELASGTYTIRETQPAGYLDGRDTQGTPGTGMTGNDVFSDVVLDEGIAGENNIFGERPSRPGISIVARTNGTDNNSGTGPEIAAGSTVTWTYVVANTGNVPLTDIMVADSRLGPIVCPATTLLPDTSMTCTQTGTAGTGQYVNVATVVGTDPLGATVQAQDEDRYLGLAPASADLSVQIDAPAAGEAGERLTYTVKATNNGSSTAREVVFSHTVPAQLRIASLETPAGWTCVAPRAGTSGTIRCTKSGMARGERAIISVTALVECPVISRTAALVATVASSTPDPRAANNSATAVVKLSQHHDWSKENDRDRDRHKHRDRDCWKRHDDDAKHAKDKGDNHDWRSCRDWGHASLWGKEHDSKGLRLADLIQLLRKISAGPSRDMKAFSGWGRVIRWTGPQSSQPDRGGRR